MMTPTNRPLLKGIEEEVYTGTRSGVIVGLADKLDRDAIGFQSEPDCRNPEFGHPPQTEFSAIGDLIIESRATLREHLAALGDYALVPGATMGLQQTPDFQISDESNPYYRYIRDTYGTRVVTASTHISIGLDDPETIVRASRLLRTESCLFLALTAASPFLEGEMSGHHSTRWIRFPHTPKDVPLFASQKEYSRYLDSAVADGRMRNNRHLWTSVRPNGPKTPHDLNRVELRICDHIPDPTMVLAISALLESRILQLLEDPTLDPLIQSDLPPESRAEDLREFVEHNEAAVANDSLEAIVRDPRTGRLVPIRQWLDDYLDAAIAVAREQGFDKYLSPLRSVLDQGNVAMRWLAMHRQGKSIQHIMASAVEQMLQAEHDYVSAAAPKTAHV